MPVYSYVAVGANGKEVKGNIDMPTREDALLWIKQAGLTLISVGEAGALSKDINLSFLDRKPSPRDMAVFCRQFVSIVSAGVDVRAALEMLSEQTENNILRRAVDEAAKGVQRGESLADAMRPNVKVFTSMFITMVEAGEASGSLETSFTRMGDQFEKDAKIRGVVKRATTYPIVLAIVAVGVVILMLAFIIPQFEEMFADLGTELPGLTVAVVAASEYLRSDWYVVAGIVVGAVLLIGAFRRSETGKKFFGTVSMKVPLFGNLVVKTACSRMSRTLSTLLAAGIPIIDAIGITSNVMSNIHFKNALTAAKEDVSLGTALSEPLQRCGLYPPMVYHMLKIGEETGSIEDMLEKMADYYDEEVEASTAQVMAALEPAIIVVMAGIIGVLIGAVMMPMASMYTALDNI